MNDTVSYYVDQLVNLYTNPWAGVGLLFIFILVFLLFTTPWCKWALVVLLLFSSTFGITTDLSGERLIRLASPLNFFELYSKQIDIFCLMILLVPTVISARGWRNLIFTKAAIAFMFLDFWYVLRSMLDPSGIFRAAVQIPTYIVIFVTLVYGLGRSLQKVDDVYTFIKCVVGAGALFVGANLFQLFINMGTVVHDGRFSGTTANPQFVGLYCSISIPSCLFVFRKRASKSSIFRFGLLGIIAFLFLFILWSGSRTGMLMAIAAVSSFYRTNIYKFIIPAITIAACIWLATQIFPASTASTHRFFDQSNSRAEAWHGMINTFSEHPLIGQSRSSPGYPEGFYLATLAYYGLVGGVLMVVACFFILRGVLFVQRNKMVIGVDAGLSDLLLANFTTIAVGCIFESSVIGTLTPITIFLYLNFTLLAFLIDYIHYVQWTQLAMQYQEESVY